MNKFKLEKKGWPSQSKSQPDDPVDISITAMLLAKFQATLARSERQSWLRHLAYVDPRPHDSIIPRFFVVNLKTIYGPGRAHDPKSTLRRHVDTFPCLYLGEEVLYRIWRARLAPGVNVTKSSTSKTVVVASDGQSQ